VKSIFWSVLLVITSVGIVFGQTFTVLYNFTGQAGDGATPSSGMVLDSAGNLYGTTSYGGDLTCTDEPNRGCGTVFKLDPSGVETVVHSFGGYPGDGAVPASDLVFDSAGNLFGTTTRGGAYKFCLLGGCGTVFEVSHAGLETVLYNFGAKGVADGNYPYGKLALDGTGNIYGATDLGSSSGLGTIFRLGSDGVETLLHSFSYKPGSRGEYPSGIIRDPSGDIFGTTFYGGPRNCGAFFIGCGVLFRLSPGGYEAVLHTFGGSAKAGQSPSNGVLRDPDGTMYGTTIYGGETGYGVVFKRDPSGNVIVLHAFSGYPTDGQYPLGGLVRDSAGNLYGTTQQGGSSTLCNNGCGIVFKVDQNGSETILHNFVQSDGWYPVGDLALDSAGNLYGTASLGGTHSLGTVFKIDLP